MAEVAQAVDVTVVRLSGFSATVAFRLMISDALVAIGVSINGGGRRLRNVGGGVVVSSVGLGRDRTDCGLAWSEVVGGIAWFTVASARAGVESAWG